MKVVYSGADKPSTLLFCGKHVTALVQQEDNTALCLLQNLVGVDITGTSHEAFAGR